MPYGCFDLRSYAACASQGRSSGFGIFVYPQLVSHTSLVYLGERNASVLAPTKAAIRSDLQLGENIVANTVGDMVAELYLQHAETEWRQRWGRIRGRPWRFCCLGEVWKTYQMRDGDPETVFLLESLRANYQRIKTDVALGLSPSNFHLRYLQYQLERYHISNYEDITQNSQERPIPHGTTWTESWPTTGTTISSGQDQVWTEVAGDGDVDTVASVNRLNNVSVGAIVTCRCETALAGDAHFTQVTYRCTAATSTTRGGPATRFDPTANTCYFFRYLTQAGTEIEFSKLVNGTSTPFATFDDDSPAENTDYVLKLTSKDDDTHTSTRDGVDKILNHSNADITGNVRCGVVMAVTGGAGRANLSAISAEDLTADVSATALAASFQFPIRTRPQPARMIGY